MTGHFRLIKLTACLPNKFSNLTESPLSGLSLCLRAQPGPTAYFQQLARESRYDSLENGEPRVKDGEP